MGSDAALDVTVRMTGEDAAGELRSLLGWLGGEAELRGRARLAPTGPTGTGSMGSGLDILSVALAPGGVATAFAAAFIAWIRSRRADFVAEIERSDGTKLKLTSKNIRGLTMSDITEQTDSLAALLDRPSDDKPAEDDPS